jgi:hypothetical protein
VAAATTTPTVQKPQLLQEWMNFQLQTEDPEEQEQLKEHYRDFGWLRERYGQRNSKCANRELLNGQPVWMYSSEQVFPLPVQDETKDETKEPNSKEREIKERPSCFDLQDIPYLLTLKKDPFTEKPWSASQLERLRSMVDQKAQTHSHWNWPYGTIDKSAEFAANGQGCPYFPSDPRRLVGYMLSSYTITLDNLADNKNVVLYDSYAQEEGYNTFFVYMAVLKQPYFVDTNAQKRPVPPDKLYINDYYPGPEGSRRLRSIRKHDIESLILVYDPRLQDNANDVPGAHTVKLDDDLFERLVKYTQPKDDQLDIGMELDEVSDELADLNIRVPIRCYFTAACAGRLDAMFLTLISIWGKKSGSRVTNSRVGQATFAWLKDSPEQTTIGISAWSSQPYSNRTISFWTRACLCESKSWTCFRTTKGKYSFRPERTLPWWQRLYIITAMTCILDGITSNRGRVPLPLDPLRFGAAFRFPLTSCVLGSRSASPRPIATMT